MKSTVIGIITALAALTARPLLAAEGPSIDERGDWWFAGGAGYSSMRVAPEDGPDRTDGLFYVSLAGGRVLTDQIWLGLEVSGWLYQPSNLQEPTRGEWVNEVALTSRVAFSKESPWQVSLGGGWATHASNHPGDARRNGTAWSAGLGYDFAPLRRAAAQVAVVFDRLDLEGEELQSVTARITWRWR